jgi:broad specificity phosphatase PhoE
LEEEMAKTTLYLVRHGQSIGNLTNRLLGQTDLDLTELGYKQAEMTAEALRDVDFCAIYSSDLLRAKNTAEFSARIHNLELHLDENLRELYIGDWENMDKDLLIKEQGDLYFNGWIGQYGTFCCPNGESVQAGTERVYRAIERIAKAHEGETVLVTFHAGVLRGFWGKISGIPAEEWAEKTQFPSNASYSIITYEDGKFTPVSFSNDEHMGAFVTKINL